VARDGLTSLPSTVFTKWTNTYKVTEVIVNLPLIVRTLILRQRDWGQQYTPVLSYGKQFHLQGGSQIYVRFLIFVKFYASAAMSQKFSVAFI
jgi:hypothetical protein